MGRAQGRLGGVQVAELRGHMSRFAVYLIHKRFGPALGSSKENESAGRLSLRSGCYHTRSVNVL